MPKKATRRARGTGGIFPDARRGGWIARTPDRLHQAHGRTQAEAIAKLAAVRPPGPATTVKEWAAKWLEGLDVRPQTAVAYRQSVELRIGPALGVLRVAAVTPYDIERAAKKWGTTVSANSVRKHLGHCRTMFGAAQRAGLVATNPVALARKPRGTKVEIDPLTAGELARVIAGAAADPKCHRLCVMAATGCRIGEAIALVAGDYAPATGLLTISRTATAAHGDGPPKSANSLRTVRVPQAARGAAAALGPALNHKTAARRWSKLLKGLGLRDRGPHHARHTVATLAIAAGAPIANVARDLGDSVDTIVRTYLHPVPGRDVCGAIEALLGGAQVAPSPENDATTGGFHESG